MFYTPHNRPPRVYSNNTGDSMTQQEFFDETDTYAIIDKYRILGAIPNQKNPQQAMYGDFANVQNLRESLDSFTRLQQSFGDLPSELRRACNDDPLQYADYLNRLYSGNATISDVSMAKTYGIDFDKSKYDTGNSLNSTFSAVPDSYLKDLANKGYHQMSIKDAISDYKTKTAAAAAASEKTTVTDTSATVV